MREPRKNREQESRETQLQWTEPSALPEPHPRDGIVHRWIRVSAYGAPDPTNVSKKYREGWEPCRADEYPELMIEGDASSKHSANGNIEIGGLLLCRMSSEKAAARDRHFTSLAERQEKAVSMNYKREENPIMPLIDQRRTSVTFGGARPEKDKE